MRPWRCDSRLLACLTQVLRHTPECARSNSLGLLLPDSTARQHLFVLNSLPAYHVARILQHLVG